MSRTRAERRAHWQEWKGAYRRDWSRTLYFEEWLRECHPVLNWLFLGAVFLLGVCGIVGVAVIPAALLWLLGAPASAAVIVTIVWLCFMLAALAAMEESS